MTSYYADTRLFTGACTIRAYVREAGSNKVVAACQHRHRRGSLAETCAKRMLRRMPDVTGIEPDRLYRRAT